MNDIIVITLSLQVIVAFLLFIGTGLLPLEWRLAMHRGSVDRCDTDHILLLGCGIPAIGLFLVPILAFRISKAIWDYKHGLIDPKLQRLLEHHRLV